MIIANDLKKKTQPQAPKRILKRKVTSANRYGEKIKSAAAAFDSRLKKKDASREVNDTYYEYERGGEFRTGTQYANVMEHLNEYICGAEDFKKTLWELDAQKLSGAKCLMRDFIDNEWMAISSSLPDEWQVKKFGHMFATANVVFMLQCFHIIEKRREELEKDESEQEKEPI